MEQDNTLIEMTADVVAAYVAKNALPSSELPSLIRDVHEALSKAHSGQPEAKALERLHRIFVHAHGGGH